MADVHAAAACRPRWPARPARRSWRRCRARRSAPSRRPCAPSSIAWRTSARIRSSCAGRRLRRRPRPARGRAPSPRRRSEATLGEMPLLLADSRDIAAERRPGDRVFDVALRAAPPAACISGVSGPIESPSPITSSVTPWRDVATGRGRRRSGFRRTGLSMLMKPGATALPRGVDLASRRVPAHAARHRRSGRPSSPTSPTNGAPPEPS